MSKKCEFTEIQVKDLHNRGFVFSDCGILPAHMDLKGFELIVTRMRFGIRCAFLRDPHTRCDIVVIPEGCFAAQQEFFNRVTQRYETIGVSSHVVARRRPGRVTWDIDVHARYYDFPARPDTDFDPEADLETDTDFRAKYPGLDRARGFDTELRETFDTRPQVLAV